MYWINFRVLSNVKYFARQAFANDEIFEKFLRLEIWGFMIQKIEREK